MNSIKYRRVIESLRYLTRTRLDLSYVVGMMSRYMEKPTMMQHRAIKHILRYVKQTTCYGLKYQRGRNPEKLINFTASDSARDIDDRKNGLSLENLSVLERRKRKLIWIPHV